jgi:hypothetical protein
MNPYLSIPIALPGDEQRGNMDKTVPCKILPAQVLAYHEGFSFGTFLYLSTGQAFCSTLTVDQYEEAVRKYWAEVGKQALNNSRKLKLM